MHSSATPNLGSEQASVFLNVYMSIILFSIAGLARKRSCYSLLSSASETPTVVRFLGSTAYLIVRLFKGE